MPNSITLPASSCGFAAGVEIGSNGENAKTAPIRMVARSTTPVKLNDELGLVVHDFAGMSLSKPRIAIDYCHDQEQVIGYANNFTLSEAGDELLIGGAIVPYSADPEDKATEVLYKAQQGVPYEASIMTDKRIVAEKVKPGVKVVVNNVQLEGPLTIFREWTLRGVAVCPYGRDMNTMSALALSDKEPVVSISFKDTEHDMPVENTPEQKPVEAEVKAVEATTVSDTPAAETPAPVAEVVEAAKPEEEPAVTPAVEVQPKPEAATVETVALSVTDDDLNGLKFLECFGEKGGVWFAQGKRFAEAQSLYLSEIKADRERLAKEVEQLKTQLAANRGETAPVSFSADTAEEVKPEPKKFTNLSDGLSKFAAHIKLPTK